MTALCGGGPSGPRTGVAPIITLGAFAIEDALVGFGLAAVAPILAPIIAGLISIEVAAYCATDPPADPGLTADEVADAISIPPTLTTFQSQQKILQWFEHRYWWQICQCTSTTTPAPPVLSNPGPASTNPGLPQGNYSQCWNVTQSWFTPAYSGTGDFPITDLYAQGLPSGVPIPILVYGPSPHTALLHAVPIDPGLINMTVTLTVDQPIVGSTRNVNGGTGAWNADGSQFTDSAGNSITASVTTSALSPQTNTRPANNNLTAPRWWTLYVQNTDSVLHTGTITLSFTCPPGVSYANACCPPDPLIEGELQQILQYVQAIYAGLPIPPNSFAEATVHSGLTGNGSITFTGLPIALKVVLTTIPAWVGVDLGDPDFYFDVGFVSFATSEGSYQSERITFVDQVLSVPLLAGSLGYTLKNGVVASITELVAGP